MTEVLVVLSAPAASARPILTAVRARWPGARLTVLLRASQEAALRDLLPDATVLHDKPRRGVRAFVRALRAQAFDHGVVAWTGAFNYWPAKLAFLLARVRVREAHTGHATLPVSVRSIGAHLFHRAKRAEHASFGMPPAFPWPLAATLAALRATVGRALGWMVLLARAARR